MYNTQRGAWGLQEAAEMEEKLVRTEVQGLRPQKPRSVRPHEAEGGRCCWVACHRSTTSPLAWRATSWSQTWRPCFLHLCMRAVAQSCPTLRDPIDCAHQTPLSMGFSRQEYWSGLPCLPARDLPDPGTEPVSLTNSCIGRRVLYH